MKIADYDIIQCPNCGQFFKIANLLSGNTFNSVSWDDGKYEAPMLPERPVFSMCNVCKEFFWVDELFVLGQLPWHLSNYDLDDEFNKENKFINKGLKNNPNYLTWKDAVYVPKLNHVDYKEALNSKISKSIYDEIFFRVRYWWALNDFCRISNGYYGIIEYNKLPADVVSDKVKNLKKLKKILKSQDNLNKELIDRINYDLRSSKGNSNLFSLLINFFTFHITELIQNIFFGIKNLIKKWRGKNTIE